MSAYNHSQDRSRNEWNSLVIIVLMILLLFGCTRETSRIYRVGILVGADTLSAVVAPFKTRMTELGYVEGQNIAYDEQRSNGDPAEEKRISGIFLSDKVDLIFAFPGRSARTVKASLQGTHIPIVFGNAIIEGTDLVDSVRSPGGNITGVRVPGTEIVLKCFEALLAFSPRFERIMVIYDPNYPTTPPALEALRAAALSSTVTLQEVRVNRLQDTQAILQELEQSGEDDMNAIQLLPDTIPSSTEAIGLILKFADAHRVPVSGGPYTLLRDGTLLSATNDNNETGRLAASLADKILQGTPAGTIPVVSPAINLYINYKKAQELGLTVPQGLLKQAVEIIR